MRPLLVFSGGMDSTLLLWSNLMKGCVDMLYVNGGHGDLKVRAETERHQRIIDKAEALVRHLPKSGTVCNRYQVDIPGFGDMPQGKFLQAVPWLYSALSVVDATIHDEVQIGYLMSDQIMVQRESIHRAWAAMADVARHRTPPLYMPLMNMTKVAVLRDLPLSLQRLTWTCEYPRENRAGRVQACGKCDSCAALKVEQMRFEILNGVSVEAYHAQRPHIIARKKKTRLYVGPDISIPSQEVT